MVQSQTDPRFAGCEGCAYWRPTSSYEQGGNTCHYCLDAGRSRMMICGPGEMCTVRTDGPVTGRPLAHKYDNNRHKVDHGKTAQYMKLYSIGKTDKEIADACGVTTSSVSNWRWRNRLAPNKKEVKVEIPEEPTGDPCQRCYSREICRRIGGTCGDKERWSGATHTEP